MAKAKRPRFRVNDRVSLAEHTPLIPAYSGKPFVGREAVLRVSSVVGKGTLREPWGVNITDDAGHFWHMQPGDLVLAETGGEERRHAKKKSPAQLQREIDEFLGSGRAALDEPGIDPRTGVRTVGKTQPYERGHWDEDPFGGYRFHVTSEGVRFDTAGVDPTYYRDPQWRRRWEFDLRREVEKFKAGKSTKLYKMSETHYRLPGTV